MDDLDRVKAKEKEAAKRSAYKADPFLLVKEPYIIPKVEPNLGEFN